MNLRTNEKGGLPAAPLRLQFGDFLVENFTVTQRAPYVAPRLTIAAVIPHVRKDREGDCYNKYGDKNGTHVQAPLLYSLMMDMTFSAASAGSSISSRSLAEPAPDIDI